MSATPFDQQNLPTSDGHTLFVAQYGQPDAPAAVVLHGGPGSGTQPSVLEWFDLARQRVVLFDQRGAGKSQPHGEIINNDSTKLVADIEMIRERLGIERWMVVGGSWGATLALAYAEAHPERVSGLALRATFLGTAEELEDVFLRALPRFYPGLSEDFLNFLPEHERATPVAAYYRRILDPDAAVHAPAARAWHDTERTLSEHTPKQTRLDLAKASGALPSTPFMEAHYFANDCFMRPHQLMDEAGKLAGIPGILVQGRYDLLCPPATSHALAARWPGSEVRIVDGAGHILYDPGIRNAVMKAIADLAARS